MIGGASARFAISLRSAKRDRSHIIGGCIAGSLVISAAVGCDRPAQERVIPAALIIGSQGTDPGHFVEPRAVASSPDGTVFVIDRTGRVQRFDSSGRFEVLWQLPAASPFGANPRASASTITAASWLPIRTTIASSCSRQRGRSCCDLANEALARGNSCCQPTLRSVPTDRYSSVSTGETTALACSIEPVSIGSALAV